MNHDDQLLDPRCWDSSDWEDDDDTEVDTSITQEMPAVELDALKERCAPWFNIDHEAIALAMITRHPDLVRR